MTRTMRITMVLLGTIAAAPAFAERGAPETEACRSVSELLTSADNLNPQEISALAALLRSDTVHFVRGDAKLGVAGSGVGVAMSAGARTGAMIEPGVWWFADGAWLTPEKGEAVRIDAGSIVLVGQNATTLRGHFGAVSVKCAEGSYACCFRSEWGELRARCIPEDEPEPRGNCPMGGNPSIGCSIGSGSVVTVSPAPAGV